MGNKLLLSFSVFGVISFFVWSNPDNNKSATKYINSFLPFNPKANNPSEEKSIKLFQYIDNYHRSEKSYNQLIDELFCESISWEYIGEEKIIAKENIKNELGVSVNNQTLIIAPIKTEKSLTKELEIVSFDLINNWTINEQKNRKCYHVNLTFEEQCIKEFHRTESMVDCEKYLYILDNLKAFSIGLYGILILILSIVISVLFSALGQDKSSNLLYLICLIGLIFMSNLLGISDEIMNLMLKVLIK